MMATVQMAISLPVPAPPPLGSTVRTRMGAVVNFSGTKRGASSHLSMALDGMSELPSSVTIPMFSRTRIVSWSCMMTFMILFLSSDFHGGSNLRRCVHLSGSRFLHRAHDNSISTSKNSGSPVSGSRIFISLVKKLKESTGVEIMTRTASSMPISGTMTS